MKTSILNSVSFALLLTGTAQATVTLNLGFGRITTSQSVTIPGGSLWALISESDSGHLPGGLLISNALSVNTNKQAILDDFAGATIASGQLVGGSRVLATGSTTSSSYSGGEGIITSEISGLDLAALGLNQGDKLGIYWFPGRTTSSNTLPINSDFEIGGFHETAISVASGGDGGMVIPADGNTVFISYFDSVTTDGGTTFDPSLFQAVVVPEPSSLVLVCAGLLFAIRRRR